MQTRGAEDPEIIFHEGIIAEAVEKTQELFALQRIILEAVSTSGMKLHTLTSHP